jgi:hypothetical protein
MHPGGRGNEESQSQSEQKKVIYHPQALEELIKKFPYLLIYKVEKESIFILAVAHAARKPGYWKSRDRG